MADAYLGMPPKEEYTAMCALIEQNAVTIEQQAASLAAKDKEIERLANRLSFEQRTARVSQDRAEQAERALAVFDAADDKDWDRLIGFLDQSAHGQFWWEVLGRFRAFVAQHGSDSSKER